ncbi:MAG: YlxR family protein [Nannocystis sp.]|nr:YlxR family protein [Nannocystis sp.]MBK9754975.1 YlxR family protein [Nannocystis sp.]
MHVPMRTCVGCRHVRPQAELLRTRCQSGMPVPALRPTAPVSALGPTPSGPGPKDRIGRSAYLCPSRSCLVQAVRRGGFARTFQAGPVTADVDLLWAALSESVNRESDLMQRSGPGRVHRLQSLAAALNASGRGA